MKKFIITSLLSLGLMASPLTINAASNNKKTAFGLALIAAAARVLIEINYQTDGFGSYSFGRNLGRILGYTQTIGTLGALILTTYEAYKKENEKKEDEETSINRQ